MFALHVCTSNKIPLVQQIICHWQIHRPFGVSRICLCSEYSMLRNQVKWHEGKEMVEVMVGFKHLCGLPSIHGVIDVTQIHILKPLWENIGFYNWACNWVFHLQWTLVIHGIYTTLSAIRQVATIATNTLCCIQYHIYGAIHMQLYATSLQLISM
jgi:hypothetical protein